MWGINAKWKVKIAREFGLGLYIPRKEVIKGCHLEHCVNIYEYNRLYKK
jgi:hypothetical protein